MKTASYLPYFLFTTALSFAAHSTAGTIWDGGGADDNWGTAANWNPDGAPPVGATIDLTFAGTTRLTSVNNYTAFDDFHSLIFDATAGAFTLSGSAIDLFGKIENYSTATQTIGMDLAIVGGQSGTGEFNPINGNLVINSANVFTNGNTLHVYGTNGKTVTFGASTVISQAGHFNVEQASNVVFLGNNTYTGTTNVLAGTLTVGNGGTTGATGTGTITVASGASLTYNRSDAVTLGQTLNIGGALVKNGAGALTISGAQTGITGTVAINAGRITLGANNSLGTAAITLNGGTIERNAPAVTVANAIAIDAGGGTILGRQVVDDYTNFSGQLTGSGALTVQGLVRIGNTTNSHSGSIFVSNASVTYLRLTASEVLGNNTAVTMGGTNANFRLDGGVTETIGSLAGNGNVFVSNVGGGLVGTLNLGGDNTSTAYTGQLSNNDGQLQIVKQGSGTFTLSPSGASFQGLTISNGTILAGSGNYGSATITLGNAGTGASDVAFLTTSVGSSRNITVSASGSGTATIGSTTGAGGGNVVFSGLITLNRATTITAASTDRTTWTGKITGNVGTLTFAGGQRTALDNLTNDFVGDVVVTGTNTVLQTGVGSGTEHIPNGSSVTVNTGAFLKLAGVASSVETINAINGAGIIKRHESVGGLVTLTIGSANGSGSFSGALQKGGGSLALIKTGNGTQILSGTNDYDGGTIIRKGTLEGQSAAAFGTGTITLGDASTGADNIALYLGNRADVPNAITVSAQGSGTVTLGANNTGSGANAATFLGAITLNRPTTLSGEVAADRLAIDGKVTGNVGTLTISGGSRTTFLSTLNDFAGDILVTGSGTVFQTSVATAAEVIPNGSSVTVDAGAIMQLASDSGAETINALNGAGIVRTFSGGSFGSGLAVGSANGSGNFSGSLQNGTAGNPLSLTKLGTGTQTLSGTNTYTGATSLSGGTLLLGSATALPSTAAFNLSTGTTLQTAGFSTSTGTVNFASGTAIFDFSGTASTITFADIGTWGGVLQVWNYAGGIWDNMSTDKLNFTLNTSSRDLSNVQFFSNNGTASIGSGAAFYSGTSGQLVPVPEPSAVAAGAVLLGVIGYRGRRRGSHR